MDGNRFFLWLWRINAVLIALAGLSVALLVGGEVLTSLTRLSPVEAVDLVAPEAPQPPVTLRYASPLPAQDTQRLILPIERVESGREGFASSASYGSSFEVNFSFVDLRTGQQSWMFRGNRQLVAQHIALSPADQAQPHARLLSVVEADSDGDQKLTYADTKRLLLTDADLQTPVEIATGITEITWSAWVAPDMADLLIQSGSGSEWLRIALPDGRIVTRQPVLPPEAAQ